MKEWRVGRGGSEEERVGVRGEVGDNVKMCF